MCVIQVYKNYFVTQIGRQIKWWNRLLSDVIHIPHYGLVMGGTEILRHGKNRRKVARYSVYRGTHTSSRAEGGAGLKSSKFFPVLIKILFITSIIFPRSSPDNSCPASLIQYNIVIQFSKSHEKFRNYRLRTCCNL